MKAKYQYRGYIEINNGGFRYCADAHKTSGEAIMDAAKLIDQIKQDVACEWRKDIRTYGAEREAH